MKRIGIIVVIVLILGSFILVPLFNSGTDNSDSEMAVLDIKGNIQAVYGEEIPIPLIFPDGLSKVELIFNDSVFETWNEPQAQKHVLAFKTNFYGVGARNLILRSTFKDGTVLESSTVLRVVSDITPELLTAKIVREYPHNKENYTQGFEFDGDQLYEATGDPGSQGKTIVGKISLETGLFNGEKNGLDHTYFGEGITILGDLLYQITWMNQTCFVYDKNTLELKNEFLYQGQGWGLCNNGKSIIMSDGSEYLYFRDPKTFQIQRTIQVYDNVGPRTNLNELEFVEGRIYANVYTSSSVIVIDPNTGKVVEEIDASELVVKGKNGGDVLNGIAYHKASKRLFFTGKYWTKTFEVVPTKMP